MKPDDLRQCVLEDKGEEKCQEYVEGGSLKLIQALNFPLVVPWNILIGFAVSKSLLS
jgi:hypothetical protein